MTTGSALRVLAVAAFTSAGAFAQVSPSLLSSVDSLPGVSNFHQVDEHLYRGAQPKPEGFAALAKLGVKTVVDLREPGDLAQKEEALVTAAGMHFIRFSLNGYHAPSDEQISRLLALLNHTEQGPFFIHCRRGADRTGTVVACYRIAHNQLKNPDALQEAKHYGMSWTEISMQHYIRQFTPNKLIALAN